MDETIGVKGGKNDRLRTIRITKKQKAKLEKEQEDQEIKELEKKVKRQQVLTFLGTLPIVAIGQTIKTLTEDENKKRLQELNEAKEHLIKSNAYSEEDTNTIIRGMETNFLVGTLPKEVRDKMGLEYKDISKDVDNPQHENVNVFEHFLRESEKDLPVVFDQERKLNTDTHNNASLDERLAMLKTKTIVNEYEKQLKEIRSELREVVFEYGILETATSTSTNQDEIEVILERLNSIIAKVEQLKASMSPEELKNYDENYLYVLIENYLKDFKAGKTADDIKDSMLFVLLAQKLTELDAKKDSLEQKVENKKETLKIDDSILATLRERYFNYENFNNQLIKFQNDQDYLLADLEQKMKNATRIEERIELQVETLNRQGNQLARLAAMQMMLPGARSVVGLTALTGTYMYFMRNIIRPRTTLKRYKVIRVEDYSKEIESSINSIEKAAENLAKTSDQLGKMITTFERDYKDYFDLVPECRSLLSNLYKVQSNLKEKEYELEKIKQEQKKNLEKNNAKVKTYDYQRVA